MAIPRSTTPLLVRLWAGLITIGCSPPPLYAYFRDALDDINDRRLNVRLDVGLDDVATRLMHERGNSLHMLEALRSTSSAPLLTP